MITFLLFLVGLVVGYLFCMLQLYLTRRLIRLDAISQLVDREKVILLDDGWGINAQSTWEPLEVESLITGVLDETHETH